MKKSSVLIIVYFFLIVNACRRKEEACPSASQTIDVLVDGNTTYVLSSDGNVYIQKKDGCEFFQKYFDPNFLDNYIIGSTVYEIADDGTHVRTQNSIIDSFEVYPDVQSLFMTSVTDTLKYWLDMTLQSPSYPTVQDYVGLRKCIMARTCTFADNRIDIVSDPANPSNKAVKFTAVNPSSGMVTSKHHLKRRYFLFRKVTAWNSTAIFTSNQGCLIHLPILKTSGSTNLLVPASCLMMTSTWL